MGVKIEIILKISCMKQIYFRLTRRVIRLGNMRSLISHWLPVVMVISLVTMSCKIDDFSDDLGSNVAPILAIASPGDTANVNEGFIVKLIVEDTTPGLSLASIALEDESGSTVLTLTETLIGVLDTIEFIIEPNQLPVGDYDLTAAVEDTEGFRTEEEIAFFGSPFKSVQSQMFMLGSMNGWGANDPDLSMTLVDDYMWEVQDVSISATDEFKFVNTPDFSDTDWSDSNCDGVAEEAGSTNIACGYNGTFTIRYNDLTLEYSVEGEVVLLSNQDQMFVLGSMNGWGSNDPDLSMTLIDDHTWEVAGVSITDTDQFKFANTPDFSDTDWSDPECDGVADEAGASDNINCGFNGTVTITYNDETFEYVVTN